MTPQPGTAADTIVIGGGMVGASIALGLALRGHRVTMLDEGDRALRAARANFALLWVQSKGAGAPAYFNWSRMAAAAWPDFARRLEAMTGIALHLSQHGGLTLALSGAEMDRLAARSARIARDQGRDFPYEMLDHSQTRALLPAIGPDVVGALFSPLDGHLNALALFHALHRAFGRAGGHYVPASPVRAIIPTKAGTFMLDTPHGHRECERVVLAAGVDNMRLAPMVGLHAPINPQRGQIMVTQRLPPFLDYPTNALRQTDNGSVLIGNSQDTVMTRQPVDLEIDAVMADRAIRSFPCLQAASVVRSWSCFRVKSPDGLPVYDHSTRWPGAFVASCHSGVTQAPNHAGPVCDAIHTGLIPPIMHAFSASRFSASRFPTSRFSAIAAPRS